MTQQKFSIQQLVFGDKNKSHSLETSDINSAITGYVNRSIIKKTAAVPVFKNDENGAADAVQWMNANSEHKFLINAVEANTSSSSSPNEQIAEQNVNTNQNPAKTPELQS